MAVVHDVLSIVGIFSILNKEITVTVVAGILTLAGYSMNDTIVIYDRMRENLRLSRKETLGEIINRSVNETLSRTIMTSMTVAITLLVLFFFGGEVIHDFAFAMLWGVFRRIVFLHFRGGADHLPVAGEKQAGRLATGTCPGQEMTKIKNFRITLRAREIAALAEERTRLRNDSRP